MITPTSSLLNPSSLEIRPSSSDSARTSQDTRQPDTRATSERAPVRLLRQDQSEGLRNVNSSESGRGRANAVMQRPATRVISKAAVALAVRLKEAADGTGKAGNETDQCRYPSAQDLENVRCHIIERIIGLYENTPDKTSAIYDMLEIQAGTRKLTYAQYMAGYFNGRLGRGELRILCDLFRHFGMLAPYQYISEKDREFVNNRMTVSAWKTNGVGTLRHQAISEYDNFLKLLVSTQNTSRTNKVASQTWRTLLRSMYEDLNPAVVIQAAQDGKVDNLIMLLSMKDAGNVSKLRCEERLIALSVALDAGYESIAMHLLMHFENSGRKKYPERLTQCLRALLDDPCPHPDLLWKLIELGADPDAQGKKTGNTALHLACANGHSLLSGFLSNERHARTDIVNAHGHMAQDLIPDPDQRPRRQPTVFTWERSPESL